MLFLFRFADEKAKNPSLLSNLNKENINNIESKSELPMLSLEPQQMKRKKKGGFNLRKSLAWNRAFFTEEGIIPLLFFFRISVSFIA